MTPAKARRITPALLRRWPLPDPRGSDSKDDRGRVLVVGGSREVPGAALLAARGAMRAGAGKLQIATVDVAAMAMAIAMPEARVIGMPADARGEITGMTPGLKRATALCDAVVLGPGMLEARGLPRLLSQLLAMTRGTVVVDAGAISAFTTAHGAAMVPVLTPHVGEMAELLDTEATQVARHGADTALDVSRSRHCIVVLKDGGRTHIAAPDGRLWLHEGGSVGLGTSGSGDVLAGIIAGLAARGAAPEQAAAWGVFLHARAGVVLERRHGLVGLLAREIADEVPRLMQQAAARD